MDKLVVLLLVAALISLSHPVVTAHKSKMDWRKLHFNCFPDDAAKAQCFASMPNAGHNTRNWMTLFMPKPEEDSYQFNGSTSLDVEDFTVGTIEEDPKYICQSKAEFVAGFHCLVKAVTTKCPWLPKKMTGFYIDMAEGLDFICSRLQDMDSVCLHSHFSSMKPCKTMAYREMRKDFDKLASSYRGRKSHRHFRHGKGFARPGGSNNTSSGSHRRWGVGDKNSTSSGNGTTWTQKGWWKGPPRNVTSNSTMDTRTLLRCRFRFVMLKCVRDTTSRCHGDTAQIMFDFMRNMYSPECRAKMQEWDEAHVLEQISGCQDNVCDAAWRLTAAPWQGLLLCLLVFLVTRKL